MREGRQLNHSPSSTFGSDDHEYLTEMVNSNDEPDDCNDSLDSHVACVEAQNLPRSAAVQVEVSESTTESDYRGDAPPQSQICDDKNKNPEKDELLSKVTAENLRLQLMLENLLEENKKLVSELKQRKDDKTTSTGKRLLQNIASLAKHHTSGKNGYHKLDGVEKPLSYQGSPLSGKEINLEVDNENDGVPSKPIDDDTQSIPPVQSLDESVDSYDREKELLTPKIDKHVDIMDEEPGQAYSVDEPFWPVLLDRAKWLVGLLVLQSCSSFILEENEALLQKHPVIVQFLTMLVGAGGNAGNQACVRVIRGLAVGSLNDSTMKQYLWAEASMGAFLCMILGVAGFVRAAVFLVPLKEMVCITITLFCIVAVSIFMGAFLPLTMKFLKIDPAHSSTTIQVVMDITGVLITVSVSSAILGSAYSTR